MDIKQIIIVLFIAFAAALFGFVIHVISAEWISNYISNLMAGRTVAPSWDVRYIAAITSIEIGLGATIIYALIRPRLIRQSSITRGLILGVLILMIKSSLLRQPLMNGVIGNPFAVVAVQDGIAWIIWFGMSLIIALSYDALFPLKSKQNQA